jgi:hypothetical protein
MPFQSGQWTIDLLLGKRTAPSQASRKSADSSALAYALRYQGQKRVHTAVRSRDSWLSVSYIHPRGAEFKMATSPGGLQSERSPRA